MMDVRKTSGYYYSKDGLDFEPLDKMMADKRHTQMYYKARKVGQWKQCFNCRKKECLRDRESLSRLQ